LEGGHVKESQLILGWIEKGRREGELRIQRTYLQQAVRARLADPVPENVRAAIEGTSDMSILDRWFDAALVVSTLEELRAAMKQP
jgi:hypothetical protein